MAPFEDLYGRNHSPICWNEIGETQMTGSELVQETTDRIAQIQQNLLAAHSHQKSYTDNRRRRLEFNVGDLFFSSVAYTLELLQELSNIHLMFHVSNFKKCLAEGNLHIPLYVVRIDEAMQFVEKPVKIMDRKDKETKRSRIPLVK
ncbi:uncharacterized protein LOC143560963, partial [Bidens hawaiensis]|uniref:uncharacterized protein LOC143560963 n=1 Tax=Bidens hawaiensis TaxID=980011 RepID=UPI00404A2FCB